ncbi:MAG: YIP1 family protein [Defluviitaleaceae bacterium]|nr:YIP1 family protein [Defluviitaleaceae bacterium]
MRKKRSGFVELSPWLYPVYIWFHPHDGFQEMKFNKKARLGIALILLFAWVAVELFFRSYADYDFNRFIGEDLSLFNVLIMTVFTFGLAVASNWCFCTLLDGKGRVRDIIVAGAYGIMPYVIVRFAYALLSHIIDASMIGLFNYVVYLAMIWSFCIIFLGLMEIHEYSFPKTVGSVFLTILGALIVFFILILLATILQQFTNFISQVYLELRYS